MAFSFEKLSNPLYFQENVLPPHSDHAFYASKEEMRSGKSSLIHSLNGVWQFAYATNEEQVIAGFESKEYSCKNWSKIVVPAHIQLEGYGHPQYTNVQYPWDGCEEVDLGNAPVDFNPVACYAKYFYLPSNFNKKRVFLSLQGAESCVAVWLNGHYVGFTGDSFTGHDFELTPYLIKGENKLAMRVYKWWSGSWMEDQDFMRFSGLFRDVYLYAASEMHVYDLKINTVLDENYQNAKIDGQITFLEESKGTVDIALRYGQETIHFIEMAVDDKDISFQIDVANAHLWSAETPHLYTLEVILKNQDGNIVEAIKNPVGIREFKIIDKIMCINGKRIIFKGVNRHDYSAANGRVVTEEDIRRDLIIMKRNNINAVRTSHYPNNSVLYYLCDELGLYVIDEANLETHGVWEQMNIQGKDINFAIPGNHMEWWPMLKSRVDSVYQRDKNHPSILIWSCGNEAFGGEVIYKMSERFRELDPSRLVHYEGIRQDMRYPDSSDMMSHMYTPALEVEQYLKENRDKPFILCEYTHSMSNSNGAMHWYTKLAYREPLYQGGFIWDFIDQSLIMKGFDGKDVMLYGGDHGDRPNDDVFCGNGIVFGDGKPTPKLQEVKYNYQDIFIKANKKKIKITNHSLFLNTSVYTCVVSLLRDGHLVKTVVLNTDVAAGEKKSYPLPFALPTLPGEYCVQVSFTLRNNTCWAQLGHEVAFGQGIFKVEQGNKLATIVHAPLRIVHGVFNTGIIGDHFSVLFSHAQGGLTSYRFGDRELLKSMPRPTFWRAPIDNDTGNGMPARYSQWKLASLYISNKLAKTNPSRSEIKQLQDGSVEISFVYGLPMEPFAECIVTYRVYPSGEVNVVQNYSPVEGLIEMPLFGYQMTLDSDFKYVRYYGMGPEENYVDRKEGARLGIFDTTPHENLTPYIRPQECGNRTGIRWAELTDKKGRGFRFTANEAPFELGVLPYTAHEMENARHPNELPPVYQTVLRIASQQMGVGGDNSWGARTHDEYLLDVSQPLQLSFTFCGITQRTKK